MLNEKQLVWRCRRGVRELDVLLTQFLACGYHSLGCSERADFERLLEVQDPTIMDWLYARVAVEDEGLRFIVDQLKKLSKK